MNVPCIKCGEANCMSVNVEDADLTCSSCNETYSAADVQEVIDGWLAVLPWLKSHPALQEQREPAATA